MWIRNKRTGKCDSLSPAEAKYKISHDPAGGWQDTQSQHCKSCGAVNHREKINCKNCGKPLK